MYLCISIFAQVRRAASSFKPAHTLASAESMRRNLGHLKQTLGLDAKTLGALVYAFPPVLGLQWEVRIGLSKNVFYR